jgi:hypothetical protein
MKLGERIALNIPRFASGEVYEVSVQLPPTDRRQAYRLSTYSGWWDNFLTEVTGYWGGYGRVAWAFANSVEAARSQLRDRFDNHPTLPLLDRQYLGAASGGYLVVWLGAKGNPNLIETDLQVDPLFPAANDVTAQIYVGEDKDGDQVIDGSTRRYPAGTTLQESPLVPGNPLVLYEHPLVQVDAAPVWFFLNTAFGVVDLDSQEAVVGSCNRQTPNLSDFHPVFCDVTIRMAFGG